MMTTQPIVRAPTTRLGRRFVLDAADGQPLGATVFAPSELALADVLVLPATAVPQSFYARFAAHAATRGLRVLTFDYRGIGASREGTLRGFQADVRTWAERDVSAAHRWLRASGDGRPLYLVGHSLGAQMLGLSEALLDHDGAVLVGAQLGWYGHWPWPDRARLAFTWHVLMPVLTRSFGYVPGFAGLSEDLPSGAALEWARWCRSPEYLLEHVEGARERFAKHRAPSLFFSFTDDAYAPLPAVESFLAAMRPGVVVHQRIEPRHVGARAIGHFGFFRPSAEEMLWRPALRFLDALRTGAAPIAASAVPRGDVALTEAELLADLGYGR